MLGPKDGLDGKPDFLVEVCHDDLPHPPRMLAACRIIPGFGEPWLITRVIGFRRLRIFWLV